MPTATMQPFSFTCGMFTTTHVQAGVLLQEAASAAGKSGPAFEQSSILSPLLSGKGETERQRLLLLDAEAGTASKLDGEWI